VLRERVQIDGMPLHVLDTAGLRDSEDEVEIEGIRRAQQEIARSDRVLYVVDASDADAVDGIESDLAALSSDAACTILLNKIDKIGQEPRIEEGVPTRVCLSAATGAGLNLLRAHLKSCVGFQVAGAGSFSARARHLEALRRARLHVEQAYRLQVERHAGELVAQELGDAQRELGAITGQVSSDELLGRIFSSFCIGK
jgi:tRNA modification GTPase